MAAVNLVSTLAMGVILLMIVVGISRFRSWHAAPASATGGRRVDVGVQGPVAWSIGFVVAALLVVTIVIAYVDGSFPAIGVGVAETLLLGVFAAGISLLLAAGFYVTARNRGLPRSMAVAAGSVVVGTLLLLAITAKLLFGS